MTRFVGIAVVAVKILLLGSLNRLDMFHEYQNHPADLVQQRKRGSALLLTRPLFEIQ